MKKEWSGWYDQSSYLKRCRQGFFLWFLVTGLLTVLVSMRAAEQVLVYCMWLERTLKVHQFFPFCEQVRPQIYFKDGIVNNTICTSLGMSPSQSMTIQEEEEMKSLNLLLVSCKHSNYYGWKLYFLSEYHRGPVMKEVQFITPPYSMDSI